MQASSVWQARVGSDHHNICIRSTESEPDPVHRLGKAPARSEMIDGHTKRTWSNASGETYTITGMGHGMPLRTGGEDGLGAAGPFMLDVGISSTRRIAEFWGIAEPRSGKSAKASQARPGGEQLPSRPDTSALADPPTVAARGAPLRDTTAPATEAKGVRKIIEDALRAAGPMQ